jgi:hypothetical protein
MRRLTVLLLTFLTTILAVLSEGLVPNSFEIIVDSNAVAKRCFVLFAVEASAFLGIVVLLTEACCAVGYP